MSQHLDFPHAITGQWLLLPHDALHGQPRQWEHRTQPASRWKIDAAALMLAVPMTVATVAGVALAMAPLV